ncbi:transposase [Variovorax sp. H27-G14]|uniref:IS66 family transposase n=1 Tax=Variovorax sp. H27-G14 TaxID=3111914 RepID=UPI0038FD0250
MPAPGLVAHVLVSRFVDHIPNYRQETINARSGVHTPRTTLASWSGAAGAELEPLGEVHRATLDNLAKGVCSLCEAVFNRKCQPRSVLLAGHGCIKSTRSSGDGLCRQSKLVAMSEGCLVGPGQTAGVEEPPGVSAGMVLIWKVGREEQPLMSDDCGRPL